MRVKGERAGPGESASVPLIDLGRAHAPLEAELLAAFSRVLASGQFVLGAEVEALERELEQAIGVEHAIAVSSGTDALLASLHALGLGPGDEVLCPSFTFFATAGSVWRAGARPVFTDVSAESFNAERADLEAFVGPRTRAILVVHLFGRLAEMDPILDLARRHDLAVIEDAAQAIGARAGGRQAGAFGATGCFSFFPTKNLGGFGEGGLVTTESPALAERIRALRNHGQSSRYVHDVVVRRGDEGLLGGNFRLDALQAALLRVKVPHVPAWNARRRELAARYDRMFLDAGVAAAGPAASEAAIGLPAPAGEAHVFHQYVIRVHGGARDALRQHLATAAIGTQIYYPIPLHLQPCFRDLGGRPGDLPVAERLAGEVLALPMHPDLADDEQRRVVDAVARFFAGSQRAAGPPASSSPTAASDTR
jgi:dTDP-4-amino-4,6-dideoxygalactose transaminase